jgi:hypothetical protein
MDYKKISASYTHPKREAEGMSHEEFISSARELGNSLAKQRLDGIVAELENNPNAGAVIYNPSIALTFDSFLALFSKVVVEFKGEVPVLPKFNDERQQQAIDAKLEEWVKTDPTAARWKAFLETKRKEFDEREARRRLVD